MQTITNIEVLVNLSTLRKGVAESVLRAYGAEREYAKALNAEFNFAWFNIEANDKTDSGKLVTAEKSELYKELKAANHSNPSTVWARVRKYGEAEAAKLGTHGLPMPVYDAEGNLVTELEQGESGGANAKRSPMLRNIEELTALWKFNAKQENLDPKIIQAQLFIGQALTALGLDLATLG
jgi:hypothetical protein